jgi:F-type H+-transporting ATPase subunit delta
MSTASNNNIAEAIYLVSKDHHNHADQSLFFKKVIQFLVKKRLLTKAPDILSRLSKIINDKEGRIVAKVSSKGNLNEKIKEHLTHSLAKRYSAKEVSIVSNLDEKLLGGFKIEVGDEVMDLTIKYKVDKLQDFLIKSV